MQSLWYVLMGASAAGMILAVIGSYRAWAMRDYRHCGQIMLILIAPTCLFITAATQYLAHPAPIRDSMAGFDSTWRCSNPGRGDPICIKTSPN